MTLQTRPNVYDIAVLDNIFLTFEPQLAFGFRFVHPAEADEFVVSYYLCPDKAALQVGMDLAGGLLRGRAAARLPRPDFILADGPVITKETAPGHLWLQKNFLI